MVVQLKAKIKNGFVLCPLCSLSPLFWPFQADHFASRFISPLKFMEMLHMPQDSLMDWKTMTLVMINHQRQTKFRYSFADAYNSYLNSTEDDERKV